MDSLYAVREGSFTGALLGAYRHTEATEPVVGALIDIGRDAHYVVIWVDPKDDGATAKTLVVARAALRETLAAVD